MCRIKDVKVTIEYGNSLTNKTYKLSDEAENTVTENKVERAISSNTQIIAEAKNGNKAVTEKYTVKNIDKEAPKIILKNTGDKMLKDGTATKTRGKHSKQSTDRNEGAWHQEPVPDP